MLRFQAALMKLHDLFASKSNINGITTCLNLCVRRRREVALASAVAAAVARLEPQNRKEEHEEKATKRATTLKRERSNTLEEKS